MAVMAKTIKPFWGYGRATVVESPVDEDQTPSGLIVPHAIEAETGVRRGILLDFMVAPGYTAEGLREGGVVYFRGDAAKIRDTYVVDLDDILGYEPED